MKLSEDKISHLSHLIKNALDQMDGISIDEPLKLLNETKEILLSYCQLDEKVDEIVRNKLQSYSRNIGEGSREWDVLYQKHFEEEMKKKW